jgi:hypothetical protein
MVTLTEGKHEGEFIGEMSMGIGYYIDIVTLVSGQDLEAGAVVRQDHLGRQVRCLRQRRRHRHRSGCLASSTPPSTPRAAMSPPPALFAVARWS